jgi:hypothetical protein
MATEILKSDLSLQTICDELLVKITDKYARSVISAYKAITTEQSLVNTLEQLMNDLRTGEDRSHVHFYIKLLSES